MSVLPGSQQWDARRSQLPQLLVSPLPYHSGDLLLLFCVCKYDRRCWVADGVCFGVCCSLGPEKEQKAGML